MPLQRAHVLGYIVTGDLEGIHTLRHLTEEEALNIFRSASDQGIAGFEFREVRYELARNSDYTFVVRRASEGDLLA